jgi:hypothetical protein
MSFIIFVIFYIVFCVAIAIRAKHRNRSAFGWFWLSFCFSPLLAICLLLILPPREEPPLFIDERTIESRKREGAIAVVIAAPIVIVVVIGLLAPFIF